MRILITGGAGFLGSHLAEHFKKSGSRILLLDNFATGRRDNLADLGDVELVEGSVADTSLVSDCFERFRPTHVIHSAAAFKDPNNWVEDVESNILGTVNIVQASQKLKVERLVHFQTALAYGRAKSPIKVDTSYSPLLSYSISKAAGEYYVMMSGLPWVSLRLANIYGPRLFTGPQPIFFKKLRNREACTIVNTKRDFIDLSDFLRLMDRVMAAGAPVGAFNVASGKDVSIPDLFGMIVKSMGFAKGDFTPPTVQDPVGEDLNSLLLDPSLTFEKFDWRPMVSVEQGTSALISWYQQNGVGETYTHFVAKKN